MKQLRERTGKRPEEVAVELGVAVSTVNNWDQLRTVPRMTPSGLRKVMEVYGCSFEELIAAEEAREIRKEQASKGL